MARHLAVLILPLLLIAFSLSVCLAEGAGLVGLGDPFPELSLTTPAASDARDYLGLAPGERFTLSQVEADLVLVEMLNVHCPHCQMQTGPYNELFERIEADPETRGKIKILGLAAGNVADEVARFVADFRVRFPIVADPQFRFHRALGAGTTPLSIYVRQGAPGQEGVVAGSHLGMNLEHERLFAELRGLASEDLEDLRRRGRRIEKARTAIAPLFSEEELQYRVRTAVIDAGGVIVELSPVALRSGRRVYTALMKRDERRERLFAEVVSRTSVCDICHDVHFVYVFDASGRVVGFEPLQLTKYGNEPWSPGDVQKMTRRVLGRPLVSPAPFDPEVDAVTSATITSAVIFDSLAQGEGLLGELREKGLL
ncbi:MAG: hypothetical protein C0617_06780 [Desulfuromonas sp.]|uniref:peroxiredoxin family protein n=1 Tax=Desulfuromonas sp. TaxID=892 RepID=UPI000CBFC7CB|nr:redoxin domain-containing protein [Desulfuromonas sp.]PLX84725.1 MAG: hypothetical protein C0617_06780 [Desulfuromonas sp.]